MVYGYSPGVSNMSDDGSQPEIPEGRLALLREKSEAIAAAADKLGLYSTGMQLGAAVDPVTGDNAQLMIVSTFAIGDLAFSKRVQQPEQEAVDNDVAGMETDLMRERLEELRRGLLGGTSEETTDGPARFESDG